MSRTAPTAGGAGQREVTEYDGTYEEAIAAGRVRCPPPMKWNAFQKYRRVTGEAPNPQADGFLPDRAEESALHQRIMALFYGPDWRDAASRYEDADEKWLDRLESGEDSEPPDATLYLVDGEDEADPNSRPVSPPSGRIGFQTPSVPAASAAGAGGGAGVSTMFTSGFNDETVQSDQGNSRPKPNCSMYYTWTTTRTRTTTKNIKRKKSAR